MHWNGTPAFAQSGYYPPYFPVFVAGPYAPPYYPQQPFNVFGILPRDVADSAPPVWIKEPGSGIRTFQAWSDPAATQELGLDSRDSSSPETSTIQVYQAPGREPLPQQDYPSMITLKNGWAYTATTYWVKSKTLHFITTQGYHVRVPLTQLDRLYEGQKRDKSANSKPPVRR